MKAPVLILALACTTALTACSTILKSPEEVASARQQLLGSWTLKEAKQFPAIPTNVLVTLRKDTVSNDNKLNVSGFSGVNHFVGTATVNRNEQRLAFSTLASTRMMGPEPQMKFEQAFLEQMEKVVNFKLESGDELVLTTLAGEKMKFQHRTQ